MTFEEARALFPVLERIAYLNAGTFGPLARPVADALVAAVERDLAEYGRSGLPYFEQTIALRDEARQAFAEPRRRRAGAGRAHELDDRGLRDRRSAASASSRATRS